MKQPMLVLVFPAEPKTELLELATRFKDTLTRACGAPPTVVRPNVGALALLVEGEPDRISAAIHEAASYTTRYLFVGLDGPHGSAGLATAHSWLSARLG